MATLKVTGCRVETKSITISFSEKIDPNQIGTYTIFAPNSGVINTLPSGWTPTLLPDGRNVSMGSTTEALKPGDWVQVTVSGAYPDPSIGGTPIGSEQVSGQVPSIAARETRDVEDAISYPVLTEEVAYRPSSPVGIPTTGAGGIAGPGAFNIGQTAAQAITDVLGWKANAADPKGFIGALTQSFTLQDVEGHVESTWKPRSYAVQTDLGGGITGAQASLYMRAKDALDQSLTLLDGLYPLDPEADPEYVKALREMARSQMTEIVKEFGVVGLPSILRIDTYFQILLGQDFTDLPASGVELDPDQIEGTLGELRDTYGIYFEGNPFNNSVQDEQDITNFRVISDYMTSLAQSWIANRKFFIITPQIPAFFGTQLVLISRQFNVVAEAVNEVRFALDSVFIGPNERQTLLLKFADHKFPPMYLEDILDEVDSFVADEGPRLLRDGGKISVTNNILPVVRNLKDMIEGTRDQKDKDVPKGFRTARVRRAMDDLHGQIDALKKLAEQVEQSVPPSEDKLAIGSITTPVQKHPDEDGPWTFSVIGNALDPEAEVTIFSTAVSGIVGEVTFVSAERIDVKVDAGDWLGSGTDIGFHDVTVTNPDGEVATLSNAFYWDGANATLPASSSVKKTLQASQAIKPAKKQREVVVSVAPTATSTSAAAAPASSSTGTGATAASSPPAPGTASGTNAAPASTATAQDISALHERINGLENSHKTLLEKLEALFQKLA
jgi:hypothetical protein